MYSRVNYTIVGIFVLLFGAGMVWFAFWLAKYDLQQEFDTYRLEMKESVAGLSIDSDVQLRGVEIGRVSKIQINPKNIEIVEVFVEVKKGIPIKEDMVASTQMFGVTGLLSIEISGGSNAAKTLVPTEEYIPLIKTEPSFLTVYRWGWEKSKAAKSKFSFIRCRDRQNTFPQESWCSRMLMALSSWRIH